MSLITRISTRLGPRFPSLLGRWTDQDKKSERAASFFLQFKPLTVAELDALIDRVWRTYRAWPRIEQITGLSFDNFDDKALLDIGGGFTSILRLFRGSRRTVLDICIDALRKHDVKWPEGCAFLSGNAHQLPFPDNSLDAVFCSNALDHFESPARVTAEVARVLRSGGYFIVTVDVFATRHARRAGLLHPHAFTVESVDRLLRDWTIHDTFVAWPEGKVGFGQLLRGDATPNHKKVERVWIASPPGAKS